MLMQFLAEIPEATRTFTVKGPIISRTFNLFGFEVQLSESIIVQWFVILLLGILFFVLGRNLKVKPEGKRQMLAETIVGFFTNMVKGAMGDRYPGFIPYIGGLFCLSLISSLVSLVGLRSPTADLSIILAWSLVTFVLIQRNKFKTGGVKGFFKAFVQPMPFMLPFNIIGEVANPVSQSLRHFANILGGSVISGLVMFALGGFAFGIFRVGVPAILSLYFDIFSSVIQAYIFCMLTMAYVTGAECD